MRTKRPTLNKMSLDICFLYFSAAGNSRPRFRDHQHYNRVGHGRTSQKPRKNGQSPRRVGPRGRVRNVDRVTPASPPLPPSVHQGEHATAPGDTVSHPSLRDRELQGLGLHHPKRLPNYRQRLRHWARPRGLERPQRLHSREVSWVGFGLRRKPFLFHTLWRRKEDLHGPAPSESNPPFDLGVFDLRLWLVPSRWDVSGQAWSEGED